MRASMGVQESVTISANYAMRGWAHGLLPTPHILDSTWWFDDATIEFFYDEMEKCGEPVVVCLGAPTLLLGGYAARFKGRLILIDKDQELTAALQREGHRNIFTADLKRELPPRFSA